MFRRIDLLFVLALLLGIAHFLVDRLGAPAPYDVISKGACVGVLALWAALQAREPDGWLITLALTLGMLGDVLLETHGLMVGALAFLAGHLVAVALYLRNRARPLVLAILVGFAVPAASWLLAWDYGVAAYALGLGAMAGTALCSRFPAAGIGALLFVASDLLIFSRLGPLAGSALPGLLIWPLYVAGQALIGRSVVTTLRSEAA